LILVKDLVVSEDVGHIDRTSLIFWCSIVFIFNSFCRVLFLVLLILGKIARFSQQKVASTILNHIIEIITKEKF